MCTGRATDWCFTAGPPPPQETDPSHVDRRHGDPGTIKVKAGRSSSCSAAAERRRHFYVNQSDHRPQLCGQTGTPLLIHPDKNVVLWLNKIPPVEQEEHRVCWFDSKSETLPVNLCSGVPLSWSPMGTPVPGSRQVEPGLRPYRTLQRFYHRLRVQIHVCELLNPRQLTQRESVMYS